MAVLGLYFCKVTVERWGGSIGCSSLCGDWFAILVSTTEGAIERQKAERKILPE